MPPRLIPIRRQQGAEGCQVFNLFRNASSPGGSVAPVAAIRGCEANKAQSYVDCPTGGAMMHLGG